LTIRAVTITLIPFVASLMLQNAGSAEPMAVRAASAQAQPATEAGLVPLVDHHRHLQSPAAAQLGLELPMPTIDVPQAVAELLDRRALRWNDAAALAELYTEQATLFDPTGPRWMRGRIAVASRVAQFFRAGYRVAPAAWSAEGSAGHIAGYFTRGEGASTR
jgi:hypothetical protein